MKEKKVGEILLPFRQGVPLDPSVKLEDRIIRAIELMVVHNLTCIAVIRNNKPVGVVRLEDAFEKVGLHGRLSF
jgi:CBS domain-containing protein